MVCGHVTAEFVAKSTSAPTACPAHENQGRPADDSRLSHPSAAPYPHAPLAAAAGPCTRALHTEQFHVASTAYRGLWSLLSVTLALLDNLKGQRAGGGVTPRR
jgi:hypothetical protein